MAKKKKVMRMSKGMQGVLAKATEGLTLDVVKRLPNSLKLKKKTRDKIANAKTLEELEGMYIEELDNFDFAGYEAKEKRKKKK